MPPKNTRKAHERGEDVEAEDMVASPLSSDAGSYTSSTSSLATSSISLSSAQLESILAANSKSMADSMTASSKSMAESLAANSKSMEASMMSLLATLTPSLPAVSSSSSTRSQVKIPKWTDDEIPYEFFTKFEKALSHNGVDKAAWGQLLPVYLAGKAQAALAQVPVASLDDYDAVKLVLLESLGDTPTSADRKWWSLYRQSGEDACSFYLRVRAIGIRRLQGLSSKEEILEKLVLSRFMSLLPSDSYTSAMARQPKDGLEAARIVQELEETKAYSRRRGWRQDHNQHNSHSSRREPNRSSSPNSGGGGTPSGGAGVCSEDGNDTGSGQSSGGSSSQASESMGEVPVGRYFRARKQVTCHECGEVGHIRPNCPLRVRSVRSVRSVVVPNAASGKLVDGLLAGVPVKGLRVDSGAEMTVVHKDFIPRGAYTGNSVLLASWRKGQFSRHRVARIAIQFGEVKVVAEVAVSDKLGYPALLGSDLGRPMLKELFTRMLDQIDDKSAEMKVGEQVVLEKVTDDPVNCENNVVPMQTEDLKVNFVEASVAQVDEVKVEVEQVAVAEAQSEEDPVPLAEIFYFSNDFFEEDPVPLAEIFDFSNDFFEEDPLPEFSVRNDESCVPIFKKCQIIEDQADAVVPGQVENKSAELLDVFNFSDSYFEPVPVLTSVSEVKPESEKELFDIPLTQEGRMSSESCWQSSDLDYSDRRFMHYYAKATRSLAPACSAVIDCMLFLFLEFLLFVLLVLKFSMCVSKFLFQQFAGDLGQRSVLWPHSKGADLPLTFSSSLLLPRTGIGGCFSASEHGCVGYWSGCCLECAEMPDENCCDLPPSGMPDAPTSTETFGQPEGGGEMLWSPPPSSPAALLTFSHCHN